uniref:XPG I-region n=1 Tax=Mimiviridae sp. ChoanoV1 TaxID=2596887 RepID=A0A5B8IQD5_9VIRU|nr:XPG I-region [Mimiviridae sp. ChoanoV1]
MGIKDLNKFITRFTPKAITRKNISTFNGLTLAVDVSIFLYKYKYSNKLIHSFLQQYYHYKKNNIELIYIFDGKPPKEKKKILESRKNIQDKQNNKVEALLGEKSKLTDENEIKIIDKKIKDAKKRCLSITKEDIYNVKKLFNILGIKYIEHNCEADLVCAYLFKEGKVNGCISNDMDFLPLGVGVLIRNYNLGDMVDIYNLDTIIEDSGMNYDEFVDFCILCGCDYTCTIPRLGFITAYKSILKYKNIEAIIEKLCVKEKKYKLPEAFDFISARKIIKHTKVEDYKINNLDFKRNLDNEKVDMEFLLNNTKFSEVQISNRLKVIY